MKGASRLKELFREADAILNDLFESGLESVLDETMRRMKIAGEECENRGLHQAAEDFKKLEELLRKKQHEMKFTPEPVMNIMWRLSEYISLCKEYVAYDNAIIHMKGEET